MNPDRGRISSHCFQPQRLAARAGVRRPQRHRVLYQEVTREPRVVSLDLGEGVTDDQTAHRVADEIDPPAAPRIVVPDRPGEVIAEVADARVPVVPVASVAVVSGMSPVVTQPVAAPAIAPVEGDCHEKTSTAAPTQRFTPAF
jgi:hypothetical protein